MKILVTGASGMVGQNLLPALKADPNNEIFSPTHAELNLLDYAHTLNFLQKIKPDLIIHLAAKVGGIQANLNEPVNFFSDNIQIGLNLVLAAQACHIKQLLNISSASIYQLDEKLFSVATNLIDNESYALAKLAVMRLCEYSHYQSGMNYKTIIPCNLYGPYDDFNLSSGHMIPAVIHKLEKAKKNNEKAVDIWGDGLARREFMFVGDLIDFILLAIKKMAELPLRINVAAGQDYSINEYYQLISEVVGYQGEFKHDLTKPAGKPRAMLDITFAKNLGWQAKTSISDGLLKTYHYFLDKIA